VNRVQHQPGQFVLSVAGAQCVLNYVERGGVVTFHHTGVPTALQGRGLAAELVEAGLQWALAQGYKVVPDCSYVAAYMARHPRWQAQLAADSP
jgi:uncharacterized protein